MDCRKVAGIPGEGEIQIRVGSMSPALSRIADSKVVVGFGGHVRRVLHQGFQDLPCLRKTLLTDEFRRNPEGLPLSKLACRDA